MIKLPFKITFWRALLGIVWIGGLYAVIVRFTQGLGAATNLSDKFPWGLWVGFDVVTGVGLAAGGFTIAGAVYVLHLKQFYPVLRPAILTAFLGYLLVIVALLIDLGHPLRIYHPFLMQNPHSVMFEVAMCVIFYTAVLSIEFSPIMFERLGWTKPRQWLSKVTIPIVILGVILSFLHQSSLGSLYLIMPSKLYPLWYSPMLPFFFLITAIATGCSMVILESHLSFQAFGHRLETSVLRHLGRVLLVLLAFYLVLKIQDFATRNVWNLMVLPRMETLVFWCEMLIGIVIPIVLLSIRRFRLSTTGLYVASVLSIAGFLFNRLNVTITGLERAAGVHYIPSILEILITLAIVGTIIFLFALAVRYLPVFGEPLNHKARVTVAPSAVTAISSHSPELVAAGSAQYLDKEGD
jgi:Ni/Fe-hydrogenase subunit HybB-like protein